MSTSDPIVDEESRPVVSVVIPTKGRADILKRAISSALCQTLDRIEVVVVVDGNDPETAAALESINDLRLCVVMLAVSVGGAEARNVGVQNAHADWIAFLDDDDEWMPEKLECQLRLALKAQAEFPVICCAYIARSAEGDALFGRKAPTRGEPMSEYMFCRKGLSYGENALATSVLFVSRALMLLVPFDSALRRHQDWDWALRALNYTGAALYYFHEPLSFYYMPDGLDRISSHQDWSYSLAWCRSRKALFTPKAFSFFIAAECFTRARDAHAGVRDLLGLAKAYWQEGEPTFRSILLMFIYLGTSKRLRRALLRLAR